MNSENRLRTVLEETLPCWHELFWENEGTILGLRIHQSYVKTIRIPPNAPIVSGYQQMFDLGAFNDNLSGNFGFNEALKNRGEKDGFYEFAIEIPTIKKVTDNVCDRCSGSGKDEGLEELECVKCEGEGKKIHLDWRRAHEISASLAILTMRLPYYDHDVPTALPQLMTFEASVNSSLHGEVSIALLGWLASGSKDSQFPDAIAAMLTAYKKMLGSHLGRVAQHSFEMNAYRGGLTASCPGEACGIYPRDWNLREGRGYEFSSHNVDTPAQQLTLLVGLAALHDIARRELPG